MYTGNSASTLLHYLETLTIFQTKLVKFHLSMSSMSAMHCRIGSLAAVVCNIIASDSKDENCMYRMMETFTVIGAVQS